MGNMIVGCPKGFDLRRGSEKIPDITLESPTANLDNVKCIATCPENKGFRFVSEGSNFKCVKDGQSVGLNPQDFMFYEKGTQIDESIQQFEEERRKRGLEVEPLPHTLELERLNVEFNKYNNNTTTLQSVLQKLKPFRPPTAPDSDIEKERKAILEQTEVSLVVAQVALFSFLLSMLVYLFLPSSYSHLLVFLILSVAIALVFFLKK